MPFPVIPVVVASGITALVTYVGVRMAMDEKCDHPHDDTKRLDETAREDEDARATFYKARRLLEARREKTQGKLESLGRQKAGTFESALIPFEETFSRIRNVDLGDAGLPPVPAEVVRGIAPGSAKTRRITAHMAEVVAGGVDALGPDALAALAACGSAGVCVSASGGPPAAATGPSAAGVPPSSSARPAASGFFATDRSASASAGPTASAPFDADAPASGSADLSATSPSDADAPASVSADPSATAPSDADAPATASGGPATAAPSGLAAGNATLAWLRGGVLPSGNGSTVILGGVAAAPVLLVSGFMLSSRAGEEAMERALSNLLDAEAAARAVGRKATEVRKALTRLQEGRLAADLTALRDLVSANDDYRTYSRPQKALVGRAASLAKAARDVAEAPLLGKDGGVPDALRQTLKKAKKVLMALDAA